MTGCSFWHQPAHIREVNLESGNLSSRSWIPLPYFLSKIIHLSKQNYILTRDVGNYQRLASCDHFKTCPQLAHLYLAFKRSLLMHFSRTRVTSLVWWTCRHIFRIKLHLFIASTEINFHDLMTNSSDIACDKTIIIDSSFQGDANVDNILVVKKCCWKVTRKYFLNQSSMWTSEITLEKVGCVMCTWFRLLLDQIASTALEGDNLIDFMCLF